MSDCSNRKSVSLWCINIRDAHELGSFSCWTVEERLPLLEQRIVYNNYPWPEAPTEAQRAAVEAAAQGVLDARSAHPGASLADLYDPSTMPPNLVKGPRRAG